MTLESNKAYRINSNGQVAEIKPNNGTDFQLDEINAIVDGYIEPVYLTFTSTHSHLLIVDEEGKLKGRPYNSLATGIANECKGIKENDFIVGDVIFCPIGMFK